MSELKRGTIEKIVGKDKDALVDYISTLSSLYEINPGRMLVTLRRARKKDVFWPYLGKIQDFYSKSLSHMGRKYRKIEGYREKIEREFFQSLYGEFSARKSKKSQ